MTAARRGTSSLGANTAANFGAQFLVPAVGLLAVPLYLRYIGLAGYGLVAILGALLASMEVFTRGLGWSLQREVARAHARENGRRLQALTSTFALGYALIGLVLGAGLAMLSAPLSDLLNRDGVGRGTVRTCLLVLALRVATVFPSSVYQATLRGLRKQLLLNAVNSAVMLASTVAMLASVAITGSVIALYVVDLMFAAASLLILRVIVARLPELGGDDKHLLSLRELRSILGLSAGLMWVQGAGMLIKQSDRLIVAAVNSLSSVGVYTAGSAAGKLLSLSYAPYLTAVFPESCAIAQDDPDAMPQHLIRNSRIVAVTAMGFGIPLALSARELLTVWTHDARIISGGTSVLVVYVAGSIMLALVDTQSQTHTALGTSRCSVIFNTAAAVLIGPITYFLVMRYGVVGAAITWLVYGVCGWLVFTYYTFIRLLGGGLRDYLLAVAVPAVMITTMNAAAAWAARSAFGGRPWSYLAVMIAVGAVVLATTGAVAIGPRAMSMMLQRLRAGGRRSSGAARGTIDT